MYPNHHVKETKALFSRSPDQGDDRRTSEEGVVKPYLSGRLATWAVELSQYNIEYLTQTAIKGLTLAYFLVECTFSE